MDNKDLTPSTAIDRVGELAAAAADLAAQPGTAVVPSGVGQAELVKAGMVEQRANLLRQKQAVEAAAAEAKALVEAQVKEMQAQLAKQMALLEPALKQLAKLSDGVDALNIYLGRDEEIITLQEGERAPAGTVITVRQLVLAMDEESLIAVDSVGMDFQDIDLFGDWLTRDPAHLEQLLPEPKGVVALIPRRADKRYGDPWSQMNADEQNRHTWWLIRNGQCVWLTSTQFVVGNHTVPAPKEFTDMFMTRAQFGRPAEKLEPGSKAWMDAEERADARTRHYMKVALLLQGLLDRTAVFHPHDGASFLDQSHYDSGRVRVILDGENALTDGRLEYREWRRERIEAMHPGMRVIGAFGSRMRKYDGKDESASVRPQGSSPSNQVPYNVRASARSYYDWEFSFDRTDTIWDDTLGQYRAPKTKATGYLSNSDQWWLPLDTITEDEILYYLGSRRNRHEYLDMVPTLRAALAVKQAEREVEAPFRAALVDALAREAGLDASDGLAGDLIHWYKTGNLHHRALDAGDAKAAKAILSEARRRAHGASKDASLVDSLKTLHPRAILIARRSSDFVVIEPEERLLPGVNETVFARMHFYTPAGRHTQTRQWVPLTRAQVAKLTIHYRTEAWDSWTLNPDMNQNFTDDELASVIEELREGYPGVFIVRVEQSQYTKDARGALYIWRDEELLETSFSVGREKGQVKLTRRYYGPSSARFSLDAPAWVTNWSGKPAPASTIWRDPSIEDLARAAWQVEHDRALAERAAKDQTIRWANRLEAAWEADAEVAVRARFIEDFGDPGLWEGHRKSITLPRYPHRWEGDKAFRNALTTLLTEDLHLDLTGKTVGEVLDLAGVSRDQVDESLLGLLL